MDRYVPGIGVNGYGGLRFDLPDPKHAEQFEKEGGVVLQHPRRVTFRVESIPPSVCIIGDGGIVRFPRGFEPLGARIIQPDGTVFDPHFDHVPQIGSSQSRKLKLIRLFDQT